MSFTYFPQSLLDLRAPLDPTMSTGDLFLATPGTLENRKKRKGERSHRPVERNKRSKKSHRPRNQKSKKATAYLPEAIVENILLRSPVKSLLRFKCVCKSWSHLIRSTAFIDNHLRFNANRNRKLLISDGLRLIYGLSGDRWVRLDSPAVSATLGRDTIKLVGEANGIICFLVAGEIIVLWNPSTREYKVLPQFSIPFPKTAIATHDCHLGFDSVTRDYYVLSLFSLQRRPHCRIGVYSLRSDSWREIQGPEFPFPYLRHGVPSFPVGLGNYCDFYGEDVFISCAVGYAGGSFFWWTRDTATAERLTQGIVSIDIAKEEFKFLEFPQQLLDRHAVWDPTPFKDSIAIIGRLDYSSNPLVEVWVMEEFGNPESWVKQLAFVSTPLIDFFSRPLKIWCPTTRKYIHASGAPPSFPLHSLYYSESLISIGGQSVFQVHPRLIGCRTSFL